MEFNLKIPDLNPDGWKKLSNMGLNPHNTNDGILYKYVSYETAIKIIENQNLLYSTPDVFNDPFDLTLDLFDTDLTENIILELFNEEIVTDSNLRNAMVHYSVSNPMFLANAFLVALEEAKSKFGISCFSKSYMKTLMWSHYANKHSGVCLGFLFTNTNGNNMLQFNMRYSDRIEPVNYFKETIISIYNWLFTKSSIWHYEEEVRRVYVDRNGFIGFEKSELREIYYGLKLSQDQISVIEELLNKHEYNFINKKGKMEINKQTFELKEGKIANS